MTGAGLPLLDVADLSAGYGGGTALHRISLQVHPGTVHAVVGHNGAGKSTLLDTIVGLMPATGGRIHLADSDVTREAPHRRARRGIGYVPQGRRVFSSVSVAEHLAIAFRGHASSRWTPAGVQELFPHLARRRAQKGWQLSGGEQQMLAIARALLTDPRLLVLDEPTEGLAPTAVAAIHDATAMLARDGMTILLAAPQPEWPVAVADAISVLAAGRRVTAMDGEDARADATPALHAFRVAP